jgi:hypothetical protein
MTETMIMMMFLFLMIFGFVHMCMLIATKHMVNYAAFAAARTAMVDGDRAGAASGVLDNLRWWNAWVDCELGPSTPVRKCAVETETRDIRGKLREGVKATYRVPFGLPIFNAIPDGGIQVIGFAPLKVQGDIQEHGDNRNVNTDKPIPCWILNRIGLPC